MKMVMKLAVMAVFAMVMVGCSTTQIDNRNGIMGDPRGCGHGCNQQSCGQCYAQQQPNAMYPPVAYYGPPSWRATASWGWVQNGNCGGSGFVAGRTPPPPQPAPPCNLGGSGVVINVNPPCPPPQPPPCPPRFQGKKK